MSVDSIKAGMSLWRALARHPYELDVQALDALVVRDRLEEQPVPPRTMRELQALDEEIRGGVHSIIEQLKRTGALGSIQAFRRSGKPRTQWWWWIDRLARGEPVPATLKARARPLARREVAPGIHASDLPSSFPLKSAVARRDRPVHP